MIIRFDDVTEMLLDIDKVALISKTNESTPDMIRIKIIFEGSNNATVADISLQEWNFILKYLPTQVIYDARRR